MQRPIQFFLFLAVVLAIQGAVHYYFYVRFVKNTQLPTPWPRVLTIAIIFLAVSVPIGSVLGRLFSSSLSHTLVYLPFAWMGTMFLLLLVVAGANVAKVPFITILRDGPINDLDYF